MAQMETVPIYIRYDERNVVLDRVASFSKEDNLIYNDENSFTTTKKFALLTLASPLITLVHLVRSVAFIATQDLNRAGREFVGALAAPFLTSFCFLGSLLSSVISIITSGEMSFHAQMRRTYGQFEAWVNQIPLQSGPLPSYSQRVTGAFDVVGSLADHIWTSAPCMQPLLEQGLSAENGLLDAERMKKIFPFLTIHDIRMEDGQVVIQSEYQDSQSYTACGGIYEHATISTTCCCCYRIQAAYDRVLCCEVGRGECTSMEDSRDACGVTSCGCCCVEVCCCYAPGEKPPIAPNTDCYGPQGDLCVTPIQRVS